MHDVELNPGPENDKKRKLTVLTLNCRGLGSLEKYRLMLNKANEIVNKGNTVIMLQETMVSQADYLNLAWRGKSFLTPGTGSSQ